MAQKIYEKLLKLFFNFEFSEFVTSFKNKFMEIRSVKKDQNQM